MEYCILCRCVGEFQLVARCGRVSAVLCQVGSANLCEEPSDNSGPLWRDAPLVVCVGERAAEVQYVLPAGFAAFTGPEVDARVLPYILLI